MRAGIKDCLRRITTLDRVVVAKGTGPDEALHHLRCHHRVADTATQEPQIARLAEIRQEHVPTNRLAGLLAGRCKVGAARG